VKVKGWGLMFHIDNSYSFWVTKHGGDAGVYITDDIFKLFEDKKSQVAQFKESIRGSFEGVGVN